MNRNALLLKMRAGKSSTTVKPTKPVDNKKKEVINQDGKFNPDVKSKYMEDNNLRKKKIEPSHFKLDEVEQNGEKINYDLNAVLENRNIEMNELIKSQPKPKRKINFTPNIKIETQTEQKETSNKYYNDEKKKIEKQKSDMLNIMRHYK